MTSGSDHSPSFTIVTPSYNQAPFLEEAMRSVLLQHYPKLEYRVVDNVSTDGSVEIIQRYASQLAGWWSRPDQGQADAISQGFENAAGEILGWLNSDDLLLPGCLATVGRYFAEHPDVDCVVGGTVVITASGRVARNPLGLPRIVRGEPETFRSLLVRRGLSFYQPASFWRADAYRAVGGLDTDLQFAMDYDLYLRLARVKPLAHVPSLLACFRLHPNSKTARLGDTYRREVQGLCEGYGRHRLPPLTRGLSAIRLHIRNLANNLPIRVGAATGRVRLPLLTH